MKSTPLYRKIIAQLEARRAELGWTCARVDDAAGLQDGYWAKLCHPDSKSGRVAQWGILTWGRRRCIRERPSMRILTGHEFSLNEVARQNRGHYA